MSSLRQLISNLPRDRISLETTSGKQITGELVLIGDDFVAVRVHAEHDNADVVPFSSIAEIRAVPRAALPK